MSNLFSSPWFLETAAQVAVAGRGARPATVDVAGQRFDLLVDPHGRLVSVQLIDFYEPRDPSLPEYPSGEPVGFLPRVMVGIRAAWASAGPVGAPAQAVAPFISWAVPSSWDQFVEGCRERHWGAFHQTARKLRKLAREAGPTRLVDRSWDHGALERLLVWKARQLRATGRFDPFTSTRTRQFLHELLEARHLHLCSLHAGDGPVAILLLGSHRGRTSCWISGYDPRLAHCSPGALIFEHAIRLSHEAGDREFDMLIGNEAYKYHYATHERVVGPLGRRTLSHRAMWVARGRLEQEQGWEVSLRKGLFDTMYRRARREALVPTPGARQAWATELLDNSPNWPAPRIQRAGDCQLMVLQATTEAARSPVERVRAELHDANLRARSTVRDLRREVAADASPAPAVPADRLSPGERVRVRSREEILPTLQHGSRDGLYYIPEVMEPLAGQVFAVERRVNRFYDERTRKVVRPRRTVALSGAVCDGSQLGPGRSCDRACLAFWHEDWLERVDAAPRQPEGGQRVRIRSAEAIEASEAAAHRTDGIAFAAATMAGHCGTEAMIAGPMTRAYDERGGQFSTHQGVVTLRGLTCPGARLTNGERCDRACTLFWRREWLEVLSGEVGAAPGRNGA